MRHMCELGHQRIAVIRGPEEMFDSESRWEGARRAAEEAGIQLDPRLIFQLPSLVNPASAFEGGVIFARQILDTGQPFTAVLAFDDLTALGVVRGLTGAGLRVPEDCSVLGFDDVLPAAVATPAITTIRQPLREMGLIASEWVVEALNAREKEKKQAPRLHMSQPELVVRMSSARPPRRKAKP